MKKLFARAVTGATLVSLLYLTPYAHAQLQYDAPSGWKVDRKAEGVVYTSPQILQDMGAIIVTAPESYNGGSIADFLKSKISNRNGQANPLADNLQIQSIDNRNARGTSFTTTAQGMKMQVLVSAHALSNGQAQRLTAMWMDNAAGAKVKPLVEKMVQQMAASNQGKPVASTNKRGTAVASTNRGTATRRTVRNTSQRPSAPVPSGGSTPKGAAIKSVSLVGSYESGVGGYVYFVYNPYVFLQNGIVLRDFEAPPKEINVPAFSQEQQRDWGRWKKNGAKTLIYWNGDRSGKPDELDPDEIQPAFPGKRGMKLNGKYSSLSGGGDTAFGGSTVVFSSKDIIFSPNGRFATNSSGGGSSSNVTTLSTRPTESGTYSIDGYGITLRFGDGRTTRKAFVIFSSKKKPDVDVIQVGSRTYIRDDD